MRLPMFARIYLGVMVALAIASLVYWHGRLPLESLPEPSTLIAGALLVGLAIAAQHFPISVAPQNKADLSMAVYFAVLLLFGGAPAVGLVAISQLLGQGSLALRTNPRNGARRRSFRSVIFNVCQLVIATAVAGLAVPFALFGVGPLSFDQVWRILVAAVALYVVNTLAVATMIGLHQGQNPFTCWLNNQRADAVEFIGLFLVGLATTLATANYPWAPLIMALPAIALYFSLRRSMELIELERSARVRAEEATAEARALQAAIEHEWAPLAAVLDGLSDGVIVFDANHRATYCNPQAADLLGLRSDAIRSMSAEATIAAATRNLRDPLMAEATWNALLSRPHDLFQGEITLAGIPPRTVQLNVFPVADRSGERIGLVLRDVSDAKMRAILEDRVRIAMDLHDGTIQSLYGVVLGLRAKERAHRHVGARSRSTSQISLDEEVARLNAVIQEVRNYIFDLRGQPRPASELVAALRSIADEVENSSSIRAVLNVGSLIDDALTPEVVTNLTMIVREAIANVVRHANASGIGISVSRSRGELVLTISDNGQGFTPSDRAFTTGHGLQNMAERAQSLGGRFTLESAPGLGVTIRISIPVVGKDIENDGASAAVEATARRRSQGGAAWSARPVSDSARG